MVNRVKRGSGSNRLMMELALLGTIALHVSFFYLLKMQTLPPPTPAEARPPPCFLLDTAVQDSIWAKTVAEWQDLAQPTLFSLPIPGKGFFLDTPEAMLPYSSEPDVPADIVAESGIVFPSLTLANPIPELPEHIQRRYTAPPTIIADRPVPAALPRTVIWRFEDGSFLTGIPDIPEAELKQALTGGTIQNPTRLEALIRAGAPARLYLANSCGNAALDRLALQRVSTKLLDWERSLVAGQKAPELDRFATAIPQVIETEWRLAVEKP